jgi:beta-glucosidase
VCEQIVRKINALIPYFLSQGTVEEKGFIDAVEGKSVKLRVEYSREPGFNYIGSRKNGGSFQPALMRGVRLGGVEKIDEEAAIEEAVSLASQVDTVIVVAGLTPEWESEGFDRSSLHLPGRQDDLISKISAVNPNTVVVLQVGSAVAMPWINSVNAIVQSWYLGNESGNGIADVLFGKINPSARLPLTLPARVEDIAAYPQLLCENGEIFYGEDLYVGYKHFLARRIKPLYPFGFGLSYTTFSFSNLSIKELSVGGADDFRLEVTVTVKNDGPREGSEVAQLYIDLPDSGFSTPKQQLKSFTKVHDISPGQEKIATLMLDKYSVSSWDPRRNLWVALEGKYKVYVGPNSFNLPLTSSYEVKKAFTWSGL